MWKCMWETCREFATDQRCTYRNKLTTGQWGTITDQSQWFLYVTKYISSGIEQLFTKIRALDATLFRGKIARKRQTAKNQRVDEKSEKIYSRTMSRGGWSLCRTFRQFLVSIFMMGKETILRIVGSLIQSWHDKSSQSTSLHIGGRRENFMSCNKRPIKREESPAARILGSCLRISFGPWTHGCIFSELIFDRVDWSFARGRLHAQGVMPNLYKFPQAG